jgi:hypothetical protein
MIVRPDYFTHWKTTMLVGIAGTEEAKLWPMMLWAHCEKARRWKFPDFPKQAIPAICGTKLDPDTILRALESVRYAYYEDGVFVVHQWEEYNSSLIASWENGKKGGRPPKKKEPQPEKPTGYAWVYTGKPRGNPSGTDKSREEESREEESSGTEAFERKVLKPGQTGMEHLPEIPF